MKFPEYLRYLISSRGLNVSEVARMTHVERSTLSRAVNGARLPKWNVVSQVSDCLRLTPDEAYKLRAYYNEIAMGEDAYRVRERVMDLILDLCSPKSSSGRHMTASDRANAFAREGFMIGQVDVQAVMRSVIREAEQSTDAHVLMSMPPDNKEYLNWLSDECRAANGIRIEHLVYYKISRDESVSNVLNGLDILEYALEMMLADGNNYHPFFLYSDGAHTTDALPNVIVTDRRLLRISDDYTRAELSSNPEAIQYYRFHITQLKAVCRPFIKFQYNPMDMMRDYSAVNAGVACQPIMNHPCTGQYITEEIIKSAMYENLPGYDTIYKMAVQYFDGLAKSAPKNTSFFTETGVKDFLKTGVISDVPSGVSRPLQPAYRREIIGRLIEDIRNDHVSAWLIDETMLSIPPNLTIGTSEYPVAVFFSKQIAEQNTPYFSTIVTERFIAQALYDFMINLTSSQFVRSREETLACLQRCLDEEPMIEESTPG